MTGSSMQTRTLAGADALEILGHALDALHAATATPITARRPWLQAWVRNYPHYQPWVVAVDGPTGLEAVAPLARRRRAGLTELVGIGDGPSDVLALPARSPEAAATLAEALAQALEGLAGPWRLALRQLPEHDPAALAVLGTLPAVRLVAGGGAPKTRFGADNSAGGVSKNHRSNIKRLRNKVRREFEEVQTDHLRDPAQIAEVLPQVERLYRARARSQNRPVRIDEPHAGPFYRDVVTTLAARGEVEILTLRLDGELAAYMVSFLDGDAYRFWNAAFDPRFSQFGPGRLMYDYAVDRARSLPGFVEFDWMKGDESYKQQFANDFVPAQDLLAWSSPAVRSLTDAPRRLKHSLRPVVKRHEPLERAWNTVKRILN